MSQYAQTVFDLTTRTTAAVTTELEDATNGLTVDVLNVVIANLTSQRNRAQAALDAACELDDEPSDEFTEGYSSGRYGTEPPTYTDPADVAEFKRGYHAGQQALLAADREEDAALVDPCTNCGEAEADEHGMCSSCLHNAYRSGWQPA